MNFNCAFDSRPEGMRILLIDADNHLAKRIVSSFDKEGYHVDAVREGRSGLMRAATTPGYDVIILDSQLPEFDGLSLVRALRNMGTATPVLFLSDLARVAYTVAALGAGADGYLIKPFDFRELVARVRALSRRYQAQGQPILLKIADLELNLLSRTVVRAGSPIVLQPREFALLATLMRHEGTILTRQMLLEYAWNIHWEPRTSVVKTTISRLRARIDKGHRVALIHTIRGRGYSLRAASRSAD